MANTQNLKPWKKGQSGNPGGRPKAEHNVRELARQHTIEAVETLVLIMKDSEQPAAARVTAADKVLDRAYGKAPQIIDATVTKLSDEERQTRILELLAEAEAAGTADATGTRAGGSGANESSKVH